MKTEGIHYHAVPSCISTCVTSCVVCNIFWMSLVEPQFHSGIETSSNLQFFFNDEGRVFRVFILFTETAQVLTFYQRPLSMLTGSGVISCWDLRCITSKASQFFFFFSQFAGDESIFSICQTVQIITEEAEDRISVRGQWKVSSILFCSQVIATGRITVLQLGVYANPWCL